MDAADRPQKGRRVALTGKVLEELREKKYPGLLPGK